MEKNKWSWTALWLGVASAFLAFTILMPILAIVIGALGLQSASVLELKKVAKTGKGLSIAGLALGIVYLVIGIYSLLN